jgi:hypothetical protein
LEDSPIALGAPCDGLQADIQMLKLMTIAGIIASLFPRMLFSYLART